MDKKKYVKMANILQSMQLICYNWFTQCRVKLTPPHQETTSILYP